MVPEVTVNPRTPKLPKPVDDLQSLARMHTEKALQTICDVMENGTSESARVSAAGLILARGWGRAPQAHTGPDGGAVNLTLRHIYEGKSPGEK
jgi:hypothetical protein